MAQLFLLCLILADAFLGLAMATKSNQPILHTEAAAPISKPPAPAPSPSMRRLGKHQQNNVKSFHQKDFSPSESPRAARETTDSSHERVASNHESNHHEENVSVEGQEEIHLPKTNHHSADKSVAGGGVILGGLATTFLVAIFCYIRATRRRHKAVDQIQSPVQTR